MQVLPQGSDAAVPTKLPPPILHPVAVRSILPLALTEVAEPYLITGAGDMLRVYDVTSPEEPEFVMDIDAHWHDVTAIRLWKRKTLGKDGHIKIEPWIISTSLDSTIRKWRLTGELDHVHTFRLLQLIQLSYTYITSELLNPTPKITQKAPVDPPKPPTASTPGFEMTEEEERELAELLDSD